MIVGLDKLTEQEKCLGQIRQAYAKIPIAFLDGYIWPPPPVAI